MLNKKYIIKVKNHTGMPQWLFSRNCTINNFNDTPRWGTLEEAKDIIRLCNINLQDRCEIQEIYQ